MTLTQKTRFEESPPEYVRKIMVAKGWDIGAKFQAKWASSASSIAPKYISIDTTTITIDWVLQFRRTLEPYKKITSSTFNLDEKIAIINELKKIRVFNKIEESNFNFAPPIFKVVDGKNCFFPEDAQRYHNNHTDYEIMDETILDSLGAALGKITFYSLLSGNVTPIQMNTHTNTFNQTNKIIIDYIIRIEKKLFT